MAQVVRDKVMDVPQTALLRAITEYEKYPEFLNEVVSAKSKKGKAAGTTLVTFELELVKRFEYILEFSLPKSNQVAWRLVESNFFKTNQGVWTLDATGEKKTKVHYELEVGFGFLVPGWITKKLTEVNLPKMFDAFEERAKSLI